MSRVRADSCTTSRRVGPWPPPARASHRHAVCHHWCAVGRTRVGSRTRRVDSARPGHRRRRRRASASSCRGSCDATSTRVADYYAGLLRTADEQSRQAEAANRLKDEFLTTLSHELRTPLNSVLGWARLLASGKLDDGADGARDPGDRAGRLGAVAADRGPARPLAHRRRHARADDPADRACSRSSRPRSNRCGRPPKPSASPSSVALDPDLHADRRRCRSPEAGRVESAVQRDQVHAQRRPRRRRASSATAGERAR